MSAPDKHGWRPVESAKPKTRYLVGWWADAGHRIWVYDIAWMSNTVWVNDNGVMDFQPTHFQSPLPPPPDSEKA